LGVDPEIAKEFAGLWVRVRKAGSEKPIIGLLKKAGSRSALFISSTQQAPYTVLYDVIEEISTYTGTLNLPDGIKVINYAHPSYAIRTGKSNEWKYEFGQKISKEGITKNSLIGWFK
jgi:hypothetical protein